jgi:hypothetical protein
MEAIVQRLHSTPVVCEANTTNALLLVFVVPDHTTVHLGDKLQFASLQLDSVVPVVNSTRSETFSVLLQANNVHDLNLPAGHGTSRTPSAERLSGA